MTFSLQIPRIQYKATFAYNLQRSLRLPYFTRTLVTLLFFLFVLFTTFNIAANGFDMEYIATDAPNVTLATRRWFQNRLLTFGDQKLDSKCLSKELAVGTSFTTANRAFLYQIRNIVDADYIQRPSIPYLNSNLHDCRIEEILINFQQLGEHKKSTNQWWLWSADTQLTNICNVTTSAGEFMLETQVADISSRLRKGFRIDAMAHASSWWGYQMMRMYWMGMLVALAQGNGSKVEAISTGSFVYTVKDHPTSLEKFDAFNSSLFLAKPNGKTSDSIRDKLNNDQLFLSNSSVWSSAMAESLSFAKVFYSLAMIDLGNTEQPNMLASDEALKSALRSPNNLNRGLNRSCKQTFGEKYRYTCEIISPSGTKASLYDAYQKIRNQTGGLGSSDATIYAQYTCSIPSRKSMVTIIWTTLLANFVLLQVAYSLVMYIATEILSRRDPTAMYCDGCRLEKSVHQGHDTNDDDTRRPDDAAADLSSAATLVRSISHGGANSSQYTLLERRYSTR